jgi:RNA polymerase sigma-70 factor (ECF subfamily)
MSNRDLGWLSKLVVERAGALQLFACQWVDAATAEDVVQQSFASLLAETTPPSNPIAWMYHAVRNAVVDHHRSSKRRRQPENKLADARSDWFESHPEERLDAQSAEAALQALDGDARQIVIMRIWGDLTFAEIATVMKLSLSTVHDRYTKALVDLRRALEKTCPTKS